MVGVLVEEVVVVPAAGLVEVVVLAAVLVVAVVPAAVLAEVVPVVELAEEVLVLDVPVQAAEWERSHVVAPELVLTGEVVKIVVKMVAVQIEVVPVRK